MKWTTHPGNEVCAELSSSGDYVISHRTAHHVVSFRPPGKHVHVGVGLTKPLAKKIAEKHNKETKGTES